MSRLKFRIWDQQRKVMLDGGALSFDTDGYLFKFIQKDYYIFGCDNEADASMNCYLDQKSHLDCSNDYCGRGRPKHKEELRFIPLRYTGFKDKHGEEIYEGYMLNVIIESADMMESYSFGEVRFCEERGNWMVRFPDREAPLWRHAGKSLVVPPFMYTGASIDVAVQNHMLSKVTEDT